MFKKLLQLKKQTTTYRFGLLQTRAYRVLKRRTAEILAPYAIAPIDWALLGLLFEAKKGLHPAQLADELGVERPFITQLIRHLERKGLIALTREQDDRRSKLVCLTEVGRVFVPKVESVLRKGMRPLLNGIAMPTFLGYVRTLYRIVENEGIDKSMQKNSHHS